MGWNLSWIFWGGMAFVLGIVNLGRCVCGKKCGWQALMFGSLSCGLLTVLTEYRMVNDWLQWGDLPAVGDVVPSMTPLLTTAVWIGIGLNLLVLLLNGKETTERNRKKNEET